MRTLFYTFSLRWWYLREFRKASSLFKGKGDSKAIDEEGKQYSGNKGKNDGGGLHADKTKTREQRTNDGYLGAQISETMDDDLQLSHRIHELQTEGQEEPDKVDIFEWVKTLIPLGISFIDINCRLHALQLGYTSEGG